MEFKHMPKAKNALPDGGRGKDGFARGSSSAAPEMERSSCSAAAREPQPALHREPGEKEDPLHCKLALNSLQCFNMNHSFH